VPSEANLERRCVVYAKLCGCILLKQQGTGGIPDRLLLMPNGRHCFIELKREGGRLSPLQLYTKRMYEALGHEVYEVDNYELFQRILNERLSATKVGST